MGSILPARKVPISLQCQVIKEMEKFTPDQFEKISRAFYREELTLGGVPFSFFGAEIYFSFINRYKVLHPVSGFQKSIKKSNWNTLAFMAHESMSQFLTICTPPRSIPIPVLTSH